MVSLKNELEIDLNVYNSRGERTTVKNVTAVKMFGETWVRPESVVKSQLNNIAIEHKIKPRQLMFLLLMYAPLGRFQEGYVYRQYNLNKMLFYQWKELEKIGLGETFDRYTFKAEKRGPVPEELPNDIEELSEKGIIKVTGGAGKNATLQATLTKEGEQLGEKVWAEIEGEFREITKQVKDKIMPLDPEHLKEIVHSEYPEYRLLYTELDK
jgi:uncharacterized protein YwgA